MTTMEEPAPVDLDATMRRISLLLAKAEATTYPAEAETYKAHAEKLMKQYRIAEENLISADTRLVTPILKFIRIYDTESPFRYFHSWLWEIVASHCGVRFVIRWNGAERFYEAHVVGYDVDIRYAEILFNSAKLAFIAKLEPSVNPGESDADNIYRLRSAGIDRQRIAEMVWGQRGHQEGLKVGRLYKEACAARGEDAVVSGRSVNAKTYREVYAREFVFHFQSMLRITRDAADAAAGAMVSVGRLDRVEEAFYERFPSERPTPEPEAAETTTTSPAKPRKSKGVTKATMEHYNRYYNSPTARRARAAGRAAAETVALDRVQGASRMDRQRTAGELGE
jgi:hypothetical protein